MYKKMILSVLVFLVFVVIVYQNCSNVVTINPVEKMRVINKSKVFDSSEEN